MRAMPPPGPFMGPSLAEVQRLLGSGDPELPITLGHGAPSAVIDRAKDGYVLRRLEENRVAANRIAREQRAERCFMPEHLFAALEPGEVIAQAATLAELAALLRAVWDRI